MPNIPLVVFFKSTKYLGECMVDITPMRKSIQFEDVGIVRVIFYVPSEKGVLGLDGPRSPDL